MELARRMFSRTNKEQTAVAVCCCGLMGPCELLLVICFSQCHRYSQSRAQCVVCGHACVGGLMLARGSFQRETTNLGAR